MIRSAIFLIAIFTLASCWTTNHLFQDEKCMEINSRAASDANIKLAIALLKSHHLKESKKKLLLAKELDARNPSVWSAFGYYYEGIGETEKAKKNYEYALLVAPHSGNAHNNYGTFLYGTGSFQKAITHFLLAIKEDDYLDAGSAYENAGFCALKLLKYQLANTFFKKAALYSEKWQK